eukprot:3174272-Prymnesium_polylepis.1
MLCSTRLAPGGFVSIGLGRFSAVSHASGSNHCGHVRHARPSSCMRPPAVACPRAVHVCVPCALLRCVHAQCTQYAACDA